MTTSLSCIRVERGQTPCHQATDNVAYWCLACKRKENDENEK